LKTKEVKQEGYKERLTKESRRRTERSKDCRLFERNLATERYMEQPDGQPVAGPRTPEFPTRRTLEYREKEKGENSSGELGGAPKIVWLPKE